MHQLTTWFPPLFPQVHRCYKTGPRVGLSLEVQRLYFDRLKKGSSPSGPLKTILFIVFDSQGFGCLFKEGHPDPAGPNKTVFLQEQGLESKTWTPHLGQRDVEMTWTNEAQETQTITEHKAHKWPTMGLPHPNHPKPHTVYGSHFHGISLHCILPLTPPFPPHSGGPALPAPRATGARS